MNFVQKLKAKVSTKAAALMAAVSAVALAAVPTTVGAAPIDFTSATINVTPADAVATGTSFANSIGGPWVLLVVGLLLAPVAIGFIIWLVRKAPKFSK